MKMQKLVEASPAIRKLAGMELPLKVSYDLSRLIRQMDEHLSFYDEAFRDMLQEHCDERDGGWYPKDAEAHRQLSEKHRELLDLEADMTGFRPVVLPEGLDIDISATDLIAMESFIIINTQEETKHEEE